MRILVVDDDAKVRGVVRAMLEREEHEVIEAEDGKAGIRRYSAGGVDLVLCDLFMPGRDGLEVIIELRRGFPGVKVIAMSGGGFGGALDLLPTAKGLGASEVLYKPFSRALLIAAIERVFKVSPAED